MDATINGVRIFYLPVGSPDNYPLIVLHGGPGLDHTEMHPWLDALSDQFYLIYVDERGQGRSERVDPSTLSLQRFAEDVTKLAQGAARGSPSASPALSRPVGLWEILPPVPLAILPLFLALYPADARHWAVVASQSATLFAARRAQHVATRSTYETLTRLRPCFITMRRACGWAAGCSGCM